MTTTWDTWRKQHSGGKYARYLDQEVLIVTKSGYLILTPCVLEELGNPDYVQVHYDKEEQRFAISADSEDERTSFSWKVAHPDVKGQVARVSTKKFMTHHGILRSDGDYAWQAYKENYGGEIFIVAARSQQPSLV